MNNAERELLARGINPLTGQPFAGPPAGATAAPSVVSSVAPPVVTAPTTLQVTLPVWPAFAPNGTPIVPPPLWEAGYAPRPTYPKKLTTFKFSGRSDHSRGRESLVLLLNGDPELPWSFLKPLVLAIQSGQVLRADGTPHRFSESDGTPKGYAR